MLESLTLKNFQCHRDLEIDFDPSITCIVGPTDYGKSSILRGLIWILLNQPRGDGFIRYGEDYAENTLHIDSHTIVRGRRKSYNYYTLDGSTPYEAFGTTVPDEISKILAVHPISIQRQLDPPFWFLLSPGQLSTELNSVVNLDLIDDILSYFISLQKKSKTAVSLSEERLEKAEAKESDLSWVIELEGRLQKIEEKEKEIEELENNSSKLQSILDRLQNIAENELKAEKFLLRLQRLVDLGTELVALEKSHDGLKTLLREIYHNKGKLGEIQQQIEELEERIQQETGGLCPLCGSEMKLLAVEKV